ncbi:hypothetical protein MHYP_G00242870 [Metynnis hypsauchen]
MEAAAFLEETLCPVLVESTVGHEEGTLPWSDLRICSEIQTLQLAQGGSTMTPSKKKQETAIKSGGFIREQQFCYREWIWPMVTWLERHIMSRHVLKICEKPLFSTRWQCCISRQEEAETSSNIRPSPCADVKKTTLSCLQLTENVQ